MISQLQMQYPQLRDRGVVNSIQRYQMNKWPVVLHLGGQQLISRYPYRTKSLPIGLVFSYLPVYPDKKNNWIHDPSTPNWINQKPGTFSKNVCQLVQGIRDIFALVIPGIALGKYRVTAPYCGSTIYCADWTSAQALLDLVTDLERQTGSLWISRVQCILDNVSSGEIVVHQPRLRNMTKKVFLDGNRRWTREEIRSFSQTLNTYRDELEVPKCFRQALARGPVWMSGRFFYVRDQEILTFITLAYPGIIREILDVRWVPRNSGITSAQKISKAKSAQSSC